MKILSKILYGIFIAAVLGVAGLLLGSMLPQTLTGHMGNFEIKIVKSGSMAPELPVGAIVFVRPAERYAVGDIITFGKDTAREIPTTHRIVSVREEGGKSYLMVKGDANEEADAKEVPLSEVIGRVAFSLPYVGFVLDFARKPLGFALLVGIPAALVILQEVIAIGIEVFAFVRRKRKKGKDAVDGGRVSDTGDGRWIHVQRRPMDEIYVPSFVKREEREKFRVDGGHVGMAAVVLVCVAFSSLASVSGGTLSYFADVDLSTGNSTEAGALDFTVEGGGSLVASIGEGDELFITTLFSPEPDTFPTAYRIISEQTGGSADFCNALDALATSTPLYSGPLIGLDTGTTTSLTQWMLEVSLPDATGLAAGDECMVDLVYQGWHQDIGGQWGYTDEERVALAFTFTAPLELEPFSVEELSVVPEPEPEEDREGREEGAAREDPPANRETPHTQPIAQDEETPSDVAAETTKTPAEPVAETASQEPAPESSPAEPAPALEPPPPADTPPPAEPSAATPPPPAESPPTSTE